MNVTELRIGNIVSIDNPKFFEGLEDVPMLVTSIEEARNEKLNDWTHAIGLEPLNNENFKYQDRYAQFIHFVKPIALTKEMLLKIGFIQRNTTNNFRLNYSQIAYLDLCISSNFVGFSSQFKGLSSSYFAGTTIYFLHQLQNLLFFLNNFKEYPFNL